MSAVPSPAGWPAERRGVEVVTRVFVEFVDDKVMVDLDEIVCISEIPEENRVRSKGQFCTAIDLRHGKPALQLTQSYEGVKRTIQLAMRASGSQE